MCAPPKVEAGPVPHAGHHHRAQPVPRPHPHRPHPFRRGQGRAMPIHALGRDGERSKRAASPRCWPSAGSSARRSRSAEAGDIVAIAGPRDHDRRRHARRSRRSTSRSPAQPIDPPTLAMTFRINDGPLAGREGDKVQSRVIRERLLREAEGNVAIRRSPRARTSDSLRSRRPRRTAARRADREHAPRGLRAHHRPPARACMREENGAKARADRGSHHRRRRRAYRRRRAEADRAQGRPRRHASLGRRPHAAALLRARPARSSATSRNCSPTRAARRSSTACSTPTSRSGARCPAGAPAC